ncbi:hypothetical protein PIROE2DRAFT_4705 [Piromyces sp. E2]|nr:hypothetical protein PIROE2DRAFT_4705 [Piromyces sp. E2]|eukprot:OUM67754.1 hypothetical protein PIROE2DRAFT_4705 [Piromyces sp. E2]
MVINSEEELFDIIKDKSLSQVIDCFNEYQINSVQFNYLEKTLVYLIKNNGSNEIINFLIGKQQENLDNINNTELLFSSLEYENYEIAKVLLRKGTKIIDKNNNSENIIEYLLRKEKLHIKNLLFILNIVKDTSLLTSKVLCTVIHNFYLKRYQSVNILKTIFLYKYYDNQFIINILSLKKLRKGISDKELKHLLYHRNNSIIKLNEKTEGGNYPLLYAIKDQAPSTYNTSLPNANIKMIRILMHYAIANKIPLEINDKNEEGEYPLLCAICKEQIEMVQLLISYAEQSNIILKMNEKNNNGDYPLLCASFNIDMVQLLINYATENGITLEMNDKNNNGDYPLLCATKLYKSSYKMVKLLINYAKENDIIMKINEKNVKGNYPILYAIFTNNIEIIHLFIEYANENNIKLEINEKNERGNYPLLCAINKNNNIEIVHLLINYAKQNNIILKMNEKDYVGDYPLLCAIDINNIEMVQLFINYAKENNIILEMNERNNRGNYPLLCATEWNWYNYKIEIVKLLINYAHENNIIF